MAASFEVPVWRCAVEDLFVCKYEAGAGQAGLGVHRDDSEVSFVVLLNDPSEFEGGGTTFVRGETPPAFRSAGGCVLFCGLRVHAGRPITGGVRYILAGFVRVHDGGATRRRALALFPAVANKKRSRPDGT